MRCVRCNSIRLFEFMDGFGQKRIFCRTCNIGFPFDKVVRFNKFREAMTLRRKYYERLLK